MFKIYDRTNIKDVLEKIVKVVRIFSIIGAILVALAFNLIIAFTYADAFNMAPIGLMLLMLIPSIILYFLVLFINRIPEAIIVGILVLLEEKENKEIEITEEHVLTEETK